jgi:sec-independent protein translocase protein TatA
VSGRWQIGGEGDTLGVGSVAEEDWIVMPNVGPMELVIVLVIALIVLGPKRLPEVGRSVGRGMREFKESLSGENDRDDEDDDVAQLHTTQAKS